MHKTAMLSQELDTLMPELITTAEVAQQLGVTRQAVVQRVNAGTLVPVYKSPAKTGTYLFSAPDVACLALELVR